MKNNTFNPSLQQALYEKAGFEPELFGSTEPINFSVTYSW